MQRALSLTTGLPRQVPALATYSLHARAGQHTYKRTLYTSMRTPRAKIPPTARSTCEPPARCCAALLHYRRDGGSHSRSSYFAASHGDAISPLPLPPCCISSAVPPRAPPVPPVPPTYTAPAACYATTPAPLPPNSTCDTTSFALPVRRTCMPGDTADAYTYYMPHARLDAYSPPAANARRRATLLSPPLTRLRHRRQYLRTLLTPLLVSRAYRRARALSRTR